MMFFISFLINFDTFRPILHIFHSKILLKVFNLSSIFNSHKKIKKQNTAREGGINMWGWLMRALSYWAK